MRKLVVVFAMAACLIGIAGQASAATISVTVSLEVVAVSVDPTAWVIGPIGLGGTDLLTPITATNDGDVPIDLNIRVVNGGGGWTVDGTSPDLNKFTVLADSGTPSFTMFRLTTTDAGLATNVSASGGTQVFDLTFTAPSSDDIGGGTAQGFDIVITASATP